MEYKGETMTKKEREKIIKENSLIMNLASDLDFPWLKDDIKEVPPEDECTDEELDYPDDEDNADEYEERYEENEDQSDAPNEEELICRVHHEKCWTGRSTS